MFPTRVASPAQKNTPAPEEPEHGGDHPKAPSCARELYFQREFLECRDQGLLPLHRPLAASAEMCCWSSGHPCGLADPDPSLCSGPRHHLGRHPRTRAAGVGHPPAREPDLPAEEQGPPAGSRGRLAGAHHHAAGVWGEAGARLVPLHWTHALWGGSARLRPAPGGLPEDVQGRRGEGAEPLRDGRGVTSG